MLYIKDPLFGNITLNDLEQEIIQTRDFQRLRYIKQLAFDFLVYPGATHSRFEHSLGTFYVTGELDGCIFGKRNEELELAGLLHDIGHAAFSHASDPVLMKFLKTTHEKIGEQKIKSSGISDIINDNGFSSRKVLSYFNSVGIGEIVTGTIGSDRIDYLMRDSLHTGVAYGILDYNRIKGKLTVYKNKPAMYEDGTQGAESLLIARYFMHQSVYTHHASEIANSMYTKALMLALENGAFDPKELLVLDDNSILERLSRFKTSKELMDKILYRRLFKRAYYKQVKGEVKTDEIAEALEKAGIASDEYIIHVSRLKGYGGELLVVDKKGNLLGKLNDMSPLVKTLGEVLNDRHMLIVATEKRKVEIARKAIKNILY